MNLENFIDETGTLVIPNGTKELDYRETKSLKDCKNLKKVVIPNGFKTIGGGFSPKFRVPLSPFAKCASLTDISIPNSVTYIGEGAFYQCSSLTNISIPDSVTEIAESAFSSCSSLVEISIPNSIKRIQAGTFDYCRNLKNVIIPNSVKAIEGDNGWREKGIWGGTFRKFGAFEGCTSLTSITIPNSVTKIEKNAFCGCSNLKSFYCPRELVSQAKKSGVPSKAIIETVYSDNRKTIYKDGKCVFAEGVTEINDEEFKYVDCIKKIRIPNGITKIGSRAFEYCKNLCEISISGSICNVGEDAFSNCKKLTKISCPKHLIVRYAAASRYSEAVTKIGDAVIPVSITIVPFEIKGASVTLPSSATTEAMNFSIPEYQPNMNINSNDVVPIHIENIIEAPVYDVNMNISTNESIPTRVSYNQLNSNNNVNFEIPTAPVIHNADNDKAAEMN